MESKYGIYSGNRKVGTATVSREGLYYRFDCKCTLDERAVCKIGVSCGEDEFLLGTPIPEGNMFTLRTKLPAKRVSGEDLRFRIVGNKEGEFIPVRPDEPFLHLKDLKNAAFRIHNGVYGIVINK